MAKKRTIEQGNKRTLSLFRMKTFNYNNSYLQKFSQFFIYFDAAAGFVCSIEHHSNSGSIFCTFQIPPTDII